ncbi:MAG: hypothetical protein ACJ73S_19185 [Mycobacteriales bacterium]
MADPVVLAESTALTEGVRFLYAQASELLRRRRERRDGSSERPVPITAPESPPGVLDRPLPAVQVNGTDLDRLESELRSVRLALADFADGIAAVNVDDPALRELAGRARGLLEALYRQRVTFAGEAGRPATGTSLTADEANALVRGITASGDGAVAADAISGQVATSGGVATGMILGGDVRTGDRPTQ